MFIVSCPVEFFSPSGATSDVPRCRSLRSLGGLFLRNYKHFAPLGLRPQNPLVPENRKVFLVFAEGSSTHTSVLYEVKGSLHLKKQIRVTTPTGSVVLLSSSNLPVHAFANRST